jgi:prephenate dehydrogenase
MFIPRIAVIGVGLIGGSLARALKQAGAVGTVTGCGRSEDHLRRALSLGVIDRYELDPARAAAGADVVILCAPLQATRNLCRAMAAGLGPETVVTDAGSVKGSVVEDARSTLGDRFARFVPGHPIAGTEKSGVEHSFAELYRDHVVILTPLAETDPQALGTVTGMWEAAGARVVSLDVADHDRILAATSHLPHMLAFALVDCLASSADRADLFRFAAGGFADFTRIASSSPEMWHDICFANREQLLLALDRFSGRLEGLRQAIAAGDSAALMEAFARAKRARDDFVHPRATGNRSGSAIQELPLRDCDG